MLAGPRGAGRFAAVPISRRELNRALLERQHLLRPVRHTPLEVVEHLVGLQAQAPLPPYLGLWARVEGFEPHELGRLLVDREAVRLTLMRGTVHLVSVADALWLRPLVQVVAERGHNGAFGRRMGGAEPAAIAAAAREALASGPLTARELGGLLVERGIGDDVEAMGYATRVHAALVQVPPRGVWGKGGQARYATLEAWTGQALEPEPSPERLVLRYLAAFGPATVMDAQSWSGLTRLRDAFERLRPRLVELEGEDGAELFDLPDAPRPGPEVRAPVRLLGEFDNVLLGHADRRRIVPDGVPWDTLLAGGRAFNNLLVDGMLRAVWWVERDGRRSATLLIRPHGRLSRDERDEVLDEAERTIDRLAPDAAARSVRVEPAVRPGRG
jgi:winged helix DNA-binding protein